MKVLDLQCQQQHSFEGWFGSEIDFQSQLAQGLVQCPLCGNADITKKLSAPRFSLGKTLPPALLNSVVGSYEPEVTERIASSELTVKRPLAQTVVNRSNLSPEVAAHMQAAWVEIAKHIMANTEDVGSSFATEARKIHYGEADERSIRGQATQDETMELIEEGIDVLPLILPQSLKGPLN